MKHLQPYTDFLLERSSLTKILPKEVMQTLQRMLKIRPDLDLERYRFSPTWVTLQKTNMVTGNPVDIEEEISPLDYTIKDLVHGNYPAALGDGNCLLIALSGDYYVVVFEVDRRFYHRCNPVDLLEENFFNYKIPTHYNHCDTEDCDEVCEKKEELLEIEETLNWIIYTIPEYDITGENFHTPEPGDNMKIWVEFRDYFNLHLPQIVEKVIQRNWQRVRKIITDFILKNTEHPKNLTKEVEGKMKQALTDLKSLGRDTQIKLHEEFFRNQNLLNFLVAEYAEYGMKASGKNYQELNQEGKVKFLQQIEMFGIMKLATQYTAWLLKEKLKEFTSVELDYADYGFNEFDMY